MTSSTAVRAKAKAPFEPPFWKRYSPHHEFPLSGVSSFCLHVLIGVIVFLMGLYIIGPQEKNPIDVDAVSIAGGGGGNPQGVGSGPGIGGGGSPGDEAIDRETPDTQEAVAMGPTPRLNLEEARQTVSRLPEFQGTDTQRLIQEAGEAVKRIARLNKDARSKLNEGLVPGKGKGGPGRGGGEGAGIGTGKGDGIGEGTATSKRIERVLRWTMIFNTHDGRDYANQLAGLGAHLAIPGSDDSSKYLLIENLRERPVRPQPKDLSQIQRIYWIDDKPDSVRSLAAALGLNPIPGNFVAFFPLELEKKLLRLELSFRNRREDEIRETRFEIRRVGGTYEPVVVSQR